MIKLNSHPFASEVQNYIFTFKKLQSIAIFPVNIHSNYFPSRAKYSHFLPKTLKITEFQHLVSAVLASETVADVPTISVVGW